MTMHLTLPDDDPLADDFVARMAAAWARQGLDPDDLGAAMLAWSINHSLATADPSEVAKLLIGIAVQINPPGAAGNA